MRGPFPPVRPDNWYGAQGTDDQTASSQELSQILWPVAPHSGDGRGTRQDAEVADLPVMTPNMGFYGAHSGDGHGRAATAITPSISMPSSDSPLTANYFAPPQSTTMPPASGYKQSPKGEAMKLVMLVVFFLLWISTASTLLFLYMDRYLFPG